MKGTDLCTAVIEPQLVYSWRPNISDRAHYLGDIAHMAGLDMNNAVLFITHEEYEEILRHHPPNVFRERMPSHTRTLGYIFGVQIRHKRKGDPEWLMPTS